jgi:hypothetical protein
MAGGQRQVEVRKTIRFQIPLSAFGNLSATMSPLPLLGLVVNNREEEKKNKKNK